MKRTDKKEEREINPNEVFRWKKLGGGSSRLMIKGQRKIIKPGQVFTATEDEVPVAFRDVMVKIDNLPIEGGKAPVILINPEYKLKPRDEDADEWDIVKWDPIKEKEGKKINDVPLSKEKAEKMIANLTE